MIRHGEYTPTAVAPQSLACLFFFAATLRLLLDYRRSGEPEDYLFAGLALLFALAELVFMYSVPWDARWWFWHLLRLGACVLALGYVTCRYLRTISDVEASLVQTKHSVETLRLSERQLRQALDDRERMSQDLHDGPIRSLFATTLSLERCRRQMAIDPNASARQGDSAIADLKSVSRDLRGYLGGVEPPVLPRTRVRQGFLDAFTQIRAYLGVISAVSGLFLIVLGVMLYRDDFALLTAIFERYGIGVVLGTDD